MSDKPVTGLKVPFGRLGGRMVAPAETLERGMACGCECPGCGAKLILRQGKKRRHFAHYNAPATDRCVELAIHSAAIQVLVDAKYMPLPILHVEVAKRAADWTEVQRSHTVRKEAIARFDECRAEVTFSDGDFGTIRADVVGYKQGRQLLVEMWYTHAVDADKLAKIERLGIPAIEIYLGDLDLDNAFAEIEQRVLGNTQYKQWLFHPEVADVKARLEADVDAQIVRIDERHVKAEEEQRRRNAELDATRSEQHRLCQAEKLAQQQALAEETRRTQAEMQARHDNYRALPLGAQLVHVRRKMSMKGTWPRFLRFENRHNGAVAVPYKLWQAAVFCNFIFGEKTDKTTFAPHHVTTWVRDWFGESQHAGLNFDDAVIAFLAYLENLGFLILSATVNSGVVYSVLHGELSLPTQRGTRLSSDAAMAIASVRGLQDTVQWNPNWPDYESVKRSVTKWISMSQKDELLLLEALFRKHVRLPTPIEFAMHMKKDMPVTLVFDFMRNYEFVT